MYRKSEVTLGDYGGVANNGDRGVTAIQTVIIELSVQKELTKKSSERYEDQFHLLCRNITCDVFLRTLSEVLILEKRSSGGILCSSSQ